MSIDQDPQSTGISQHPLEHGLDAPVVIPPAGQRHEDYFPKKNVLRRVVGGTAVVAILAGGGILGKSMLGGSKAPSAENPAPTPDTTSSASLNERDKSTKQIEASLTKLDGQTKAEQIQFVIDNPVTVAEYPTPELQLEGLGMRFNAILNSGEINLDAPVNENGYYPLTVESQDQFDQMVKSIYDESSDGYGTLYVALLKTTQNHALILKSNDDLYTSINAQNDVLNSGNTSTLTGTVTTESRSDERFNSQSDIVFTLKNNNDNTVKIAHTNEVS